IKSKKDLASASEKLTNASRGMGLTGLSAYCLTDILPTVAKGKGDLLKQIIDRATANASRAEERDDEKKSAAKIAQYVASVKSSLDAYGALAKPTQDKPSVAPAFAVSTLTVIGTGDPMILAVSGTGLTGMTSL